MKFTGFFCRQKNSSENFKTIPVSQIVSNPFQPRKSFSENSINELSESIKKYGLIQPVTVRKISADKYELVAGERRLKAVIKNGDKEIKAIIRNVTESDSSSMALIENLQRENLSCFEEAYAYSKILTSFNITQEELAGRLGKSQSSIANKLRLLKLSERVIRICFENKLTERHARALLKLSEKQQLEALEHIIIKNLNVTQTEALVESLKNRTPEPKNIRRVGIFKNISVFSNTINSAINLMKEAGIDIFSDKKETDEYIEYYVKIPKETPTCKKEGCAS